MIESFNFRYQILIFVLILSPTLSGWPHKPVPGDSTFTVSSPIKDGKLTAQVFTQRGNVHEVIVASTVLMKEIEDSALAGFGNLVNFKAEFNQLAEIEDGTFTGANTLCQISLKGNKITDIGDKSLLHLESLSKIDLSQNELEVIPEKLFTGSSKLIWVDLSHNRITGISKVVLPNALEHFYMNANPIRTVRLWKFTALAHLNTLYLKDIGGVFRFPPKQYQSISIRHLQLSTKPPMKISEPDLINGLEPFRMLESIVIEFATDLQLNDIVDSEFFRLWPRLVSITLNKITKVPIRVDTAEKGCKKKSSGLKWSQMIKRWWYSLARESKKNRRKR